MTREEKRWWVFMFSAILIFPTIPATLAVYFALQYPDHWFSGPACGFVVMTSVVLAFIVWPAVYNHFRSR